ESAPHVTDACARAGGETPQPDRRRGAGVAAAILPEGLADWSSSAGHGYLGPRARLALRPDTVRSLFGMRYGDVFDAASNLHRGASKRAGWSLAARASACCHHACGPHGLGHKRTL